MSRPGCPTPSGSLCTRALCRWPPQNPALSLDVTEGPTDTSTATPAVMQPHCNPTATLRPPLGRQHPWPLTQPPPPVPRPAQPLQQALHGEAGRAARGPSQGLERRRGKAYRSKAIVQEAHGLPHLPHTQRPLLLRGHGSVSPSCPQHTGCWGLQGAALLPPPSTHWGQVGKWAPTTPPSSFSCTDPVLQASLPVQ